MEDDLYLMTYLCMSYNKYLIKRKKLSNACSKNKSNDNLRNKLVEFIHLHPDHELRRQTCARDLSTDPINRELHNEKIKDLIIPAENTFKKRTAYKSIREAETEARTAKHNSRMEAEKAKAIENKALKIQKAREINNARIIKEKAEGETIRLARKEIRKKKE